MKFASKLSWILLALLLALLLGWLVYSKEGGCDRDPIDDPRPACKPGDKECQVDAPAEPKPPPIGGAP